jgi:ATP-dependent protease ClpP protease subunit
MAAKISIIGEIGWEVEEREVQAQFDSIDPHEDLEIDLSSPGGSVFQGVKISNMIRDHKGKVTLTISSLAASMGAVISQRADIVRVHDDSTFMIHNPRMFSGGDFIEFEKNAKILKSLATMLAGPFVKKSGRPISEIQPLMNAETWLFGQEIVDAGFADELIESESPEEKDDAVAFAKLQFTECMAKLKKFEGAADDHKNIAALLPTDSPKPAIPVIKNQIMEKNMTFEEFLAANPEEATRITAWLTDEEKEKVQALALTDVLALAPLAKTEHEQAIETATAEAKTELDADKLSEADARYIATIIGSEAYQGNNAVVNTGIDTFAGKNDMKNFRTVVAMADQNAEMIKSLKIKAGQPDATPADEGQGDLIGDGKSIKSPKIQASIENIKSQIGV